MKTAHLPSKLRFLRRGDLHGFMAVALTALLGTVIASAQTAPSVSHPATPVAGVQRQAAIVPVHHGEEEKGETKPDDASHQGIKIHGHWKIDIKNPDGTLASAHEFENSLADGGVLFSYLLSSRATPGEAAIFLLESLNGSGSACSPSVICLIAENPTGFYATSGSYCGGANSFSCNFGLTVAPVVQSGCDYYCGKLVLSGSYLATSTGSIIFVSTVFAACSSPSGQATVTPAQCNANQVPPGTSVGALPSGNNLSGGAQNLTATAPAQPINVVSGQTIQVTVTLSFS